MYYGVPLPPISASNKEITASTNRICIKPAALYTKKPNIQPITSITAMMYKMLLMSKNFYVECWL